VPASFNARVNEMIAAQDDILGLPNPPVVDRQAASRSEKRQQRAYANAAKALRKLGRSFTTDVEAFLRVQSRRGVLTHSIRTGDEALRAIVLILLDIRDSLAHLVDGQRFQVCSLSPFCCAIANH